MFISRERGLIIVCSWYAGEAIRNYGDVIPSSIKGVQNIVIKQPIGVCGISALYPSFLWSTRLTTLCSHALERELIRESWDFVELTLCSSSLTPWSLASSVPPSPLDAPSS
jgi:hypothetical protein